MYIYVLFLYMPIHSCISEYVMAHDTLSIVQHQTPCLAKTCVKNVECVIVRIYLACVCEVEYLTSLCL